MTEKPTIDPISGLPPRFHIGTWHALSFAFTFEGQTYAKDKGSDDFFIDTCEYEVHEDDPDSQQIPALLMWLYALDAIEMHG